MNDPTRPKVIAAPNIVQIPPGKLPHLSPRQTETLACLLAGFNEKQVAQEIGISAHTAHVYVKRLYKLFGVSTRSSLILEWLRLKGWKIELEAKPLE